MSWAAASLLKLDALAPLFAWLRVLFGPRCEWGREPFHLMTPGVDVQMRAAVRRLETAARLAFLEAAAALELAPMRRRPRRLRAAPADAPERPESFRVLRRRPLSARGPVRRRVLFPLAAHCGDRYAARVAALEAALSASPAALRARLKRLKRALDRPVAQSRAAPPDRPPDPPRGPPPRPSQAPAPKAPRPPPRIRRL